MGVESELALTAIRVSVGLNTTEQDADSFAAALSAILAQFRRTSVRAANI
jgi:cysteine sulfinate desulfinase/cysteine desulfurase-like protein